MDTFIDDGSNCLSRHHRHAAGGAFSTLALAVAVGFVVTAIAITVFGGRQSSAVVVGGSVVTSDDDVVFKGAKANNVRGGGGGDFVVRGDWWCVERCVCGAPCPVKPPSMLGLF